MLHVEPLALGLSASAQVQRVDGESVGHQLFSHPQVMTAMRVEAVDDHHDTARRLSGRHERKKIFSPPVPSNFSSLTVLSCACVMTISLDVDDTGSRPALHHPCRGDGATTAVGGRLPRSGEL